MNTNFNCWRYLLQVDWMKRQGYGGWMVWAIDLDDFTGNYCSAGKYPLLKLLNRALDGSEPTYTPGTPGPT